MDSLIHTEQALWSDVPCWKNKDGDLIRNYFSKAKTSQVYVDKDGAIECMEWSSTDFCPNRNFEQHLELQLTNKMLIGLSDGSIKLLQYDTQGSQNLDKNAKSRIQT